MMTVISDPKMRKLYANAATALYPFAEREWAKGRDEREAFILALNAELLKRLQVQHERDVMLEELVALRAAAEKMAETAMHLISTGSGASDFMGALLAYRSLSRPEQQEGPHG